MEYNYVLLIFNFAKINRIAYSALLRINEGDPFMKRIALVGGATAFSEFLALAFDGEIVEFADMETAGCAALSDQYEAIIIIARKNELIPMPSLDGLKTYTKLWNRGQKVYAELCDLQDSHLASLFGVRVYGAERAIFNENFVFGDAILQAPDATFQPASIAGGAEIARIERCIGSHTPSVPGNERSPVIVSNKGFLYSATRLSLINRLTALPNARWRSLFSSIFAPLLGVNAERVEFAFNSVFPPMRLATGENSVADAVRRAVEWHYRSGIMPDASGKCGLFEMIRSRDFNVKYNQRTDVMLLSAALLTTAGAALSEPDWVESGKNLANHCLDEGLQITEGESRGILRWFDSLGAVGTRELVFASDNGRCGMALIQLYRQTGEARYLESARLLGDAYLRWADGEPYLKQTAFSPCECDLGSMKRSSRPCNAPVFYDGMALLLANLYRITGDDRYRNQLKLTADALAQDYPDGYATNFTPLTKSFVYSRLMIALAAAQEIGCGNYSEIINELIMTFRDLQDPSGGVQDAGLVIAENTFSHEEFAVSMGKDQDKIVDMLYCTNNLLGCFSLISGMKNTHSVATDVAETMRRGLINFLLRTQITENDDRLCGGWMRAYDMENGEYYGVNKDLGWGPYCIMGGWVMGLLPLLLLADNGSPSIYGIE